LNKFNIIRGGNGGERVQKVTQMTD